MTGLWGQLHVPNIAALTGVEDLRITQPVMSARYHEWFNLMDPDVLTRTYPTTRITHLLGSPLVGAFNVKYFLRGKVPFAHDFSAVNAKQRKQMTPAKNTTIVSPNVRLAYADEDVEIYENRVGYRPRAFFARSIAPVVGGINEAKSALREWARSDGTWEINVVEAPTATDAELLGMLGAPPQSATPLVIYPSQSEVAIESDSPHTALLVLNDLYEEGWSATIDGKAAPVLPVNLVSRGVVVPPGRHLVHLTYWPPGLTAGLVISALSLAVLVLMLARSGYPRNRCRKQTEHR